MTTLIATTEQRLTGSLLSLGSKPEFQPIMGLLASKPHVIDEACKTAYASVQKFGYGRAFIESLSNAEIRGLILHEFGHYLFGHLTDYTETVKEDPQLANVCMDYAINAWIEGMRMKSEDLRNFIRLPEGGLYNPDYHGWAYLDIWEKEKRKPRNDDKRPMDDHIQGEDSGMSKEDVKRESENMRRALDAAITAGKLLGNGDTDFGGLTAPKIDWRDALREFMREHCEGYDNSSWARFNRRLVGAGIYMPSHYSTAVEQGVVAPDTSGSITPDTLGAFMGEIASLAESMQPTKLDMLVWGSSVVDHKSYNKATYNELRSVRKLKDGGGTEPNCIGRYIRAKGMKPKFIVVLTDGAFTTPNNFGVPTLWVVVHNPRFVAPFGKVCYI